VWPVNVRGLSGEAAALLLSGAVALSATRPGALDATLETALFSTVASAGGRHTVPAFVTESGVFGIGCSAVVTEHFAQKRARETSRAITLAPKTDARAGLRHFVRRHDHIESIAQVSQHPLARCFELV